LITHKLKKEDIWSEAEKFRRNYVKPADTIPVLIDDIIELDLKIEIIPLKGLKERTSVEGFINHKLNEIIIDNDLYFEDKNQNRLRFTLAHEIGHLILHQEEIKKMELNNLDKWMKFRQGLSENDNDWFEWQAREFAGRLLVPTNQLVKEIQSLQMGIDQYKEESRDSDLLIQGVSKTICNEFGVSGQVIAIRIQKEGLTELFK